MERTHEHNRATEAITLAIVSIKKAHLALKSWEEDYDYHTAPSIDYHRQGKDLNAEDKAAANNTFKWIYSYDEAVTGVGMALDYVIEAMNTLREATGS